MILIDFSYIKVEICPIVSKKKNNYDLSSAGRRLEKEYIKIFNDKALGKTEV